MRNVLVGGRGRDRLSVDEGCRLPPRQLEWLCLWGRKALSYFLAFFSARFSFMVFAGFFLVSLRASWLFPMGMLLVMSKCAAMVWCRSEADGSETAGKSIDRWCESLGLWMHNSVMSGS